MKRKQFNIKHLTFIILMLTGSALAAAPVHSDNGDGTVTDKATGLIWQKCSMGRNNDSTCSDDTSVSDTSTWASAVSYCNGLTLAGKTWRLPNVNEIESIVDRTKASGAMIDTTTFPATVASVYWSASMLVSDIFYAWGVDFDGGFVSSSYKTYNYYVRCVTN